jgi:RNA polymerase sigma factor (sigma-70 family)
MATAQMNIVLRHIRQLTGGVAPERSDRQLLDDFAGRRDETAFAILVARHGEMVLRVCRRVLDHEQDAEDAFQATFLVLARNSASIRKREAVAGWLHGVAQRTARRAKRTAARRRRREGQSRSPAPASPPGLMWEEVRTVLDEEVKRLAEPFRSAFVLCILEGKTGPEAAAVLGCKEATVYTRMNRARRLLQKALAARGIELATLLGALAIADGAAQAAPGTLIRATVGFGLLVAAGESAAGVIPARVAALAAGVTRAMFLSKTNIALTVLFAVGLLAAGAGALAHQSLAAREPPSAANKAEPPAPKHGASHRAVKAEAPGTVTYAGTVLDPDGKPFRGARIWLGRHHDFTIHDYPAPKVWTTTGSDGRFTFEVTETTLAPERWSVVLVATADGFGPGFQSPSADGKKDVTLRLAKDDVPVAGRILDLQGKPVGGVKVKPVRLSRSDDPNLDAWVKVIGRSTREAAEKKQFVFPHTVGQPGYSLPGLPAEVTTDAEGRFRLTGIGRERLVDLRLQGAGMVITEISVLTRPMPVTRTPPDRIDSYHLSETYYGATVDFVAAPSQPFEGVVTDQASGKPLPNVIVRRVDWPSFPHARTDANGRYRLDGLPTGEQQLVAVPPIESPYCLRWQKAGRKANQQTITANFELYTGVWISGTVSDARTGKPIEAQVLYRPYGFNSEEGKMPGYAPRGWGEPVQARCGPDGKFKVLGVPGKGYVLVSASARYLTADFTDWQGDVDDPAPKTFVPTSPAEIALNFHAVCMVTANREKAAKSYAIKLDPGVTVRGTLLDADGQPLTGASMFSMWGAVQIPLPTAEFTLEPFNPQRPHAVLFLHPERKCGALFKPAAGETGPFKVQLQPTAAVAGRIVDADDRPVANAPLQLMMNIDDIPWSESAFHKDKEIRTDADGRFTITHLVEGESYQLRWPLPGVKPDEGYCDVRVKAGENKNLGTIKHEPKPRE